MAFDTVQSERVGPEMTPQFHAKITKVAQLHSIARLQFIGDLKITGTSTERQKRSEDLAPALVMISGNSLVFSRKTITSTGFYRCCAPGASAPVVVKNLSPNSAFIHQSSPIVAPKIQEELSGIQWVLKGRSKRNAVGIPGGFGGDAGFFFRKRLGSGSLSPFPLLGGRFGCHCQQNCYSSRVVLGELMSGKKKGTQT